MTDLPIYKLQEAREIGILSGLSIVTIGDLDSPNGYEIFYSFEESSSGGQPWMGYVTKRNGDKKLYKTLAAAMTDFQKIYGSSNSRVLTLTPHSHDAPEAYIEHISQPDFELTMST